MSKTTMKLTCWGQQKQNSTNKKNSGASILVRGKSNQLVLLLGALILVITLLAPPEFAEAKTHHSKRQALTRSSSGRENSNWWNSWWQQYISEAELPTVRPIVSVSFRGRTIHSNSDDEQQLALSDPDLSHELDDSQEDVDANLVLGNQRQAQQPINQELSRLENERQQRLLASGGEIPRAANKHMMLVQRKSMQHHHNWQAVKPTFIQSGNRQPVDDSPLGIQMRRTMRIQQQQQFEQQQQQQFEQQQQQRFEEQQQHQMFDYNEDELIDQNNNPDNEQPSLTSTLNRPSDSSSMMSGEGVVGPTSSSLPSSPTGPNSASNEPTGKTLGEERTRATSGPTQPTTSTTTATTQTEISASPTSRPVLEETTTVTMSAETTTSTTTQMPSTVSSFPTTQAIITTATSQSQDTGGSTTEIVTNESPNTEQGTRLTTSPQNQVQLENGKPATSPTTPGTLRPPTNSKFPSRTTMTQPETQSTPIDSTTSLQTSSSTTMQPNQPEINISTQSTSSGAAVTNTVSKEGTTSPAPQLNETTTTTNSDGGESGDDDDDDDADDNDEGSTTTDSPGVASSTTQTDNEEDDTSTGSTTESTPSITTSQPVLPTIDIERIPKTTSTTPKSTQTTDLGETPIVSSTSRENISPTTQGTTLSGGSEDITRITKPAMSSNSEDKNPLNMMTTTTQRGPVDDEMAITMPMDSLMKMMMNQMAEDEERAKLQEPMNSSIGTTALPGIQSTTSLASITTSSPTGETSTATSTTISTSTSLGTTMGGSNGEMTTDSQQTTRGRLQPPPTTRAPQQTATNNEDGSAIMTTLPAAPPQRTVMVNLRPETTNQAEGENSEGREPKIEMLDLDLMPIQRIMSENQDITRKQTQMIMVPIARLVEKPVTSGADPGQAKFPMGEERDQEQQRPMTTVEVEPGMRLRPPQMPTTNSMMVSSIIMRSQQQSNKAAEPVYMIMMNNNQQSSDGNEQYITTTADNKPTTQTSSTTTKTTAPARTTPGMMVMMMQRQQQQQEMQLQTLKTNRPTTTTFADMDSTEGKTTQMRTTQTAVPTQQFSTTTLSDTTKQQQLLTTTQAPQTTGKLQEGAGEQGVDSSPGSEQTGGSSSTETTTSSPNTLLITDSPASVAEQAAASTTTRGPIVETSTELERFVTTARPAGFTQPTTSTTTTSSPITSESSQDDNSKMVTTTSNPVGTSDDRQTTQKSTVNLSQQEQTGTAGQILSTPPSKMSTGLGPARNQTNGWNQREPNRQTNVKGTTGRVGKQQFNGTSPSFIPSKLRADFGKNRLANQANVNQPSMGAAIRQFGGANRMSVLGNQPVPFGRPAAMTMPTRNQHQIKSRIVVEQPSFEYGPSIVVRRPDEPLATGQMPNCTLTGKNFCVLTKDYPMNEVRQAVERSFRSVRIMYEELQTVSDQELHKDQFNTTNNQAASGKFACQTQVEMMRPGWAKDEITKEWMLVVNTDVFPQRVRTESCAQPNTPCEFIAPFYDSTCQQRYSLHRMIAIDPHDPSRSPQVAVFRFPAGCVCRVHPIRKTTTTTNNLVTTSAPITLISSSSSGAKPSRRRR